MMLKMAEIKQTQVVDTNGQGHGALASFLTNAGVEVLICGGIGGGAQAALAAAGIQLFGGVSGDADEAVRCFVSGNLNYNPEVRCSHHAHEHSCGEHHCGENKTVAVAIEEMFIDEYPCLSVVKSWKAGIFLV